MRVETMEIEAGRRILAGQPVIQSAVNFSEGRRQEVVAAIAGAIRREPRAVLADCSADPDHNRMVATVLGPPQAAARAVLAAFAEAVARIDLRQHRGAHPRIGAVDVIPLVPLRAVSMEECVDLSRQLGEEIGRRFGVQVYLYERSAGPGRRASLPEIRNGGFEGLFLEPLEGSRAPDYGHAAPHPTAGACVVGARGPLAAVNINIEGPLVAARRIASWIRARRGVDDRVRGVRALGLALPSRGLSQVSMNLTEPERTPLPPLLDLIAGLARDQGAAPAETEVVGLVPEVLLGGQSPQSLMWRDWHPAQIVERWLEPPGAPIPWEAGQSADSG